MHDRGYVEAPARVRVIWRELESAGIARRVPPRNYPDRHILEVHDAKLVSYMRRACKLAGNKKSIYPYVFPVRNQTRPPKEQTVLAGYYCIDTFTPLNENAWLAARRAVDCTMTAADLVLAGAPSAYALVRPPGHHAEITGLRWLLLFQQRGHRGQLLRAIRPRRNPRHRLSPRQRPAGHLLYIAPMF